MTIPEIIQTACSVLSLIISLFIANKVYKIDQKLKVSGDRNKVMMQTTKGNGNNIAGKQ